MKAAPATKSIDTCPQVLVHQLLASRLRIDKASIRDTDRFEDLGLTPLDIVLVVLRLDQLDRGDGEFPLLALENATTVGDLVEVVELWLQADTVRSPVAPVAQVSCGAGNATSESDAATR
jgi:acyl carrier protein